MGENKNNLEEIKLEKKVFGTIIGIIIITVAIIVFMFAAVKTTDKESYTSTTHKQSTSASTKTPAPTKTAAPTQTPEPTGEYITAGNPPRVGMYIAEAQTSKFSWMGLDNSTCSVKTTKYIYEIGGNGYGFWVAEDGEILKVTSWEIQREITSSPSKKSSKTFSEDFNVDDYNHPDDFYDYYYDDFLDPEEAEDYYYEHGGF